MAMRHPTGMGLRPRPPRPPDPPPLAWKVGDAWHGSEQYQVFVNGKLVPAVFAYDMDSGIVNAYCLAGHSGYGGEKHLNPLYPDLPCTITVCGRVEVRRKETS